MEEPARGDDKRASLPLHVLLVVDSLHTGGGERHAVDLALALHTRGHHVTAACSDGGSLSTVLEERGVEIQTLGHRLIKRRVSIPFAWALRRLVRQEKYDIVHTHMYASAAAVALATLGTRSALVHTEHSEARWRKSWARWVSRWVYRRATRVIAVSHPIRRRLVEWDGVPARSVRVIPCAIPAAPRFERSSLPPELRHWRLVGVVARLQPEKGVATFLDAVARVWKRIPDHHFVVVGDGPLRAELECRVRDLGLEQRVHFLGFRSDARALLPCLDVLVVPSLSEGTPLVVLEAMAAGVPVVATQVGGIPDQIRHAREGLLVPPNDPMALGQALLDLLQNPAYAHQLGEAGRRRVEDHYSYAAMVERIERVYREVLDQRGTRTRAASDWGPVAR